MRTTSIIIPTFNGLRLLQECIASIRQYTHVPYEIIVVDNASSDGTSDYCRRERITFVSLPTNVGFPAACNFGLRVARGDALLLLNNDVIVTHHWLSNLLLGLDSRDQVGIVGPMTNYVSSKQMSSYAYANLEEFHQLAYEVNQSNPLTWRGVERLVGFCFLFKRELMDCIGYLDERFSPGHFEDDDYCMRARMSGYNLVICGDTIVHHHGSASFKETPNETIKQLLERNHRLFMEKWNVDPHIYI